MRLLLLASIVALVVGGGVSAVVAGPGAALPEARAPARSAAVRIAAVGDIAMVASEDGGASYFAGVRSSLRGGVVLGNLEGTLTERGLSKCGAGSQSCFAFRAPPSYGRLLKRAGFNVLNLANNHGFDYGPVGQRDTVATLDRLGLRHTGRPGEFAMLDAGGVRVAVVGFAPYPWAQSLTDLRAARALVRRADASADLVVVTMHAGAEGRDANRVRPGSEYFLGENRGDVMAFAHAVVDAGADLVVGHGPHVLRGMEWYRGRLVAYSLGNFLGCRTLSTSGILALSGILRVTLRGDGGWVGGDLVPLRLAGCGVPERDPVEATHGFVRELSRKDFGRRGVRVSFTGTLLPPG